MKRPENELRHSDLAKGIKSTRRLLAYLLRATHFRMRSDALGSARFMTLPSEIGDALLAIVISERSPLAFYRAFCTRFFVDPSGGDSEYGAIEAWLPEGRSRWDHVCAALDYAELRTVIRESPEFFSTFACARGNDPDDTLFDAFPDPIQTVGYKPRLPESLIAPRGHRAVWTLVSPMHHGADTKTGNVSLFRRHTVPNPLTGTTHDVPFISGNAIRGMLRDIGMGAHLQLLGLKAKDLPPVRAHALLAGGAVEKGADTGTVNNFVRARARELCPPWDLFAGCIEQQIMSGRGRVGDATLVCRETAWKTREIVAPEMPLSEFAASLPSCDEMMEIRQLTRHKHADIQDSDGVQMLANFELIREGQQMTHTIQVWGFDGVEPTTSSFLAYLLSESQKVASVGAGAARSFGSIAFDGYVPGPGAEALPSPDSYLEYVTSRRQEMIDWLMMANDPATAPGKPKIRKRETAEAAE